MFLLKNSEHTKNILRDLIQDEASSDVTFVSGSQRFYAHFGLLVLTMPSILDLVSKDNFTYHGEVVFILSGHNKELEEALETSLMELYMGMDPKGLKRLLGLEGAKESARVDKNNINNHSNIQAMAAPKKVNLQASMDSEIRTANEDVELPFEEVRDAPNCVEKFDHDHKRSIDMDDYSQMDYRKFRKEFLECNLCHKSYGTLFGLKKHRNVAHGIEITEPIIAKICPICKKSVKYIDQHLTKIHGAQNDVCEVCNQKVKGFKKHRGKCRSCVVCGYESSHKDRLLKHIKKYHK